jgi:uncharacterized protein YoxC
MTIDISALLTMLWIVVAILLIAVLIYVLTILVDVRKIVKRTDHVCETVENKVMAPMTFVDSVWNNVLKAFNIIDATDEKVSNFKKRRKKK